MTISSISTSYLATALLPAINQAQTQLATLQVESASGEYANLGLHLGEQSGQELSLKSHDDLLQTITTSNQLLTMNISTATTAIDAISTTAQSAVTSLITYTTSQNNAASLQTLGEQSLRALVGNVNATSAGQYVFGGINSGVQPLADYSSTPPSATQTAMLQAFQTNFGFSPTSANASSITAASLQSFLTGPFAQQFQGSNWTATWSSASSTNTTAQIAPGQTIDTSTNANAPGFQQLAQGYAMLAAFGGANLSAVAQSQLISTATSLITQGHSALTQTEANLGQAQSEIDQANTTMASQMTILQTQIGNLDNVSPQKVATELSTLTTQIETAYQLTAQIHKLSLAQYLPA